MNALKIKQAWVMAVLTAAETMRQPVCLLLTAVCVVLTGAMPLLMAHTFGDGSRLARDSGLAFQLLFGLFVAGYAACSTLDRERSSGTIAAVLSKPVGRGTFFAAKFLGICGVIMVFSVCVGLASMLAERAAVRYETGGFVVDYRAALVTMLAPVAACGLAAFVNWRWRRCFQSTALLLTALMLLLAVVGIGFVSRQGGWSPYHPQLQWQILTAAALNALGLLVLAAIAVTLAVRLSLVPVIFSCLSLLVLGLMSSALVGRYADVSRLAAVLYAVIPNWQNFWLSDAMASGGIELSRVVHGVLYGVFYMGAMLCIGITVFRHSEVS
jgi:hypothetical protein